MKTKIFQMLCLWGLSLFPLSTLAAAQSTPAEEHAQKRALVRYLWEKQEAEKQDARKAAERANDGPPEDETERGKCGKLARDFFWEPGDTPSAWAPRQLEKAILWYGAGNKDMGRGDLQSAAASFWWAAHGAGCALATAGICRQLQADLACLLSDVLFLEGNPSAEWLLLPRFPPAFLAAADGLEDIPHLLMGSRVIDGKIVRVMTPPMLLRGAAEDAQDLCEDLRTGRTAHLHARLRRIAGSCCHTLVFLHDLQPDEPSFRALLAAIRRSRQECERQIRPPRPSNP